jgi:hypothetical protein
MSTKRKIEDYKDQKVAIHCSTKEEWDKIVDLLPSNKNVKKFHWQDSVINGKSDTINISSLGWSPKKHFEDKGCTIYPASDFLEEEKPFKFNIGDEIKAKPGGYYICEPRAFAEEHKVSLPSSESKMSGKITERTQAKGFNWYRCGNNNWITEEGIESVKEDIPEYVECIDTGYFISGCSSVNENNLKKGTIYKVSSKKPESYYSKKIVLETEKGHIEIGCNNYQTLYKSSTKEAFDLQNKPKTMSENIFCIKLNSQEELDTVMDFYKQKGFKELGDSHKYYTGYVVFIKMKDKKWQTSVCNDLNYPVKTLSELGIEVKSKSLVGRYLKSLVDYPDAGGVLKGEIGIITEEYNDIPTAVDFPNQKRYMINSITYKNGESYELMPEGFKPEDDLISEAKKKYPIGTKFRPAHIPGSDITEYCIVTEDSIFHKNGDGIVLTINGCWWDRENPKYGNTNYNRVIYHEGKWAEIVSDEPEINTYGLKVGDTLKAEIINTWSLIEGNFCSNVQRGWVGVFGNYIEDRKIEDFRNIDGQIGFHVSGCAKGTHYLKAEGFKEFADNFYKKEMLEMLPYPKDNYFKAVVVKDIHKKDITTQGNIPDLIPKGYQTWFRDVGTNYRERIFQNECIVCPENNRWKANIPAEYFQIVGDDKYNNIPKECYPSNEIIIPQIIKAQKTIQKITIESPTELDLKLKTIKPKQIQTIKI